MKKHKPVFLLIRGTIFPFDVLITTADYDAVLKHIIKKKKCPLDDHEKESLDMKGNGRTVMLRGGQTIIRLPIAKTQIGIDLPDLAHEIEHAVAFIYDRIGIKHTMDSDEAFAYYQGYLMREALRFFDPS